MSFGSKLTELRENRGLSQEELAEELQVSRQTISNWENDKVSVDVDKAVEICRFFSVDMNYLFYDEKANESCHAVKFNPVTTSAHDIRNLSDNDNVQPRTSTQLWRSAMIISAILLAVFLIFEIVVACCAFLETPTNDKLDFEGQFETNSSTSTLHLSISSILILGMLTFGGFASLISLVMLVFSFVMYRKNFKKDHETAMKPLDTEK